MLGLEVRGKGYDGSDDDRLINWYQRNGFKGSKIMIREPE